MTYISANESAPASQPFLLHRLLMLLKVNYRESCTSGVMMNENIIEETQKAFPCSATVLQVCKAIIQLTTLMQFRAYILVSRHIGLPGGLLLIVQLL